MDPKVIALYLPQFYPFKENDEWWGKGFTEWTNVGKAKPLFKGHQQPRVPADLGYYDLRLPEVREQQAELAREAGVTAFCYWHYWFGNGKRLLERVFDEVLETGKPDFPFCLGWANHSWYAKTWNKDSQTNRLLVEQTYPGIEDARSHFAYLLNAFNDSRYFKVEGKPFFLIFDVDHLPDEYLRWFEEWTKEAGYPGLYLVANVFDIMKSPEEYLLKGYSAVIYNRLTAFWYEDYIQSKALKRLYLRIKRVLKQLIIGLPRGANDYGKTYHRLISDVEKNENVIPEIVPQWDHSLRSGRNASTIFFNVTPDFFYQHVCEALDALKDKKKENQLLILKSWNEWGEGNYIEPDLIYGKGFLESLKRAISDYKDM